MKQWKGEKRRQAAPQYQRLGSLIVHKDSKRYKELVDKME